MWLVFYVLVVSLPNTECQLSQWGLELVLGEAVHIVVERVLLRLYFRVLRLPQSFAKRFLLSFLMFFIGFLLLFTLRFFWRLDWGDIIVGSTTERKEAKNMFLWSVIDFPSLIPGMTSYTDVLFDVSYTTVVLRDHAFFYIFYTSTRPPSTVFLRHCFFSCQLTSFRHCFSPFHDIFRVSSLTRRF